MCCLQQCTSSTVLMIHTYYTYVTYVAIIYIYTVLSAINYIYTVLSGLTWTRVWSGLWSSPTTDETCGLTHTALNVKKPQRTRWSSSFIAFQRLLRVQSAVMFTLTEWKKTSKNDLVAKLDARFWSDLKLVTDFLEPFKAATDVIQSDRAGLFDVFLQFRALMKHVRNAPATLAHGAHIMRKAINNHWTKHVNQQAAYMCAKFACEKR